MGIESFWDEETSEEVKQEPAGSNTILVPLNLHDVAKEIELLKENLDYMETIKARQMQRLISLQEDYMKYVDGKNPDIFKDIIEGKGRSLVEVSAPDKDILKITLDHLLPYYPKNLKNKMPYYIALTEVYQEELIKKLFLHKHEIPSFTTSEKVFVLIVQYPKGNKILDLDNRFHSFIFNALRSAQITPDDRWQRLSYMEDGRVNSQEEKTEIYVGNYSDLFRIIEVSKGNS